jgi:TctA family transporter
MNPTPTDFGQLLSVEFGAGYGIVAVIFYVLVAVALWKVFSKAGYPGILGLIPIVNVILLVKIAGYSGWLSLLLLIPIVNFVFAIMVAVRLGAHFGKGAFFSVVFLWLFAVIGYFIIGFGSARYRRS